MMSPSVNLAPTLMPLVRYRDVPAAIDWLTRTFDFESSELVTDRDGAILYALLSLGTARIMIEPAMTGADATAGREQRVYIVVPDADAHYARTCSSSVEIELALHDFGQGGRGYSCRDCEGHIWSFGTYDPWQSEKQARVEPLASTPSPRKALHWALVSAIAACIVTSAVAATILGTQGPVAVTTDSLAPNREVALAAREAEAQLSAERDARTAAERAVEKLRAELENERQAKVTAEQTAGKLQTLMAQRTLETTGLPEELEQERRAREAAEQAGGEAKASLESERSAITATKQELTALNEKLQQEQAAKETAERAQADASAALERERASAAAAAQALAGAKDELAREKKAREADKRAAAVAVSEAARERAAKDLAWKSVAELRKQLARARANANTDYVVPADPPVASSGPGGTPKGDAQYNGPMSPF